MRFIKIALVFLSIAFFLAACTANTTEPITTNSTANNAVQANTNVPTNTSASNTGANLARELYTKQRCIACHQENGEGGKNVQYGDIAIDEVPNFKNPKIAQEPDSEYIKKIKNGGDGMPKFKDKLNDEEIKLLVNYIRQEFQGKQ